MSSQPSPSMCVTAQLVSAFSTLARIVSFSPRLGSLCLFYICTVTYSGGTVDVVGIEIDQLIKSKLMSH